LYSGSVKDKLIDDTNFYFFFALSPAPPVFARKIASRKPVAINPRKSPARSARTAPDPLGPIRPSSISQQKSMR
jgi:hypothetical protein